MLSDQILDDINFVNTTYNVRLISRRLSFSQHNQSNSSCI